MPDLDVVMKSLRRCSDMTVCPDDCYYRMYAPDCIEKLHRDAINLMKEQNELLKQQAELLEEQERVVRCKECRHKGNPYECRLDRDLEEHGAHRTEEWDDWFCGDGSPKEGEQE